MSLERWQRRYLKETEDSAKPALELHPTLKEEETTLLATTLSQEVRAAITVCSTLSPFVTPVIITLKRLIRDQRERYLDASRKRKIIIRLETFLRLAIGIAGFMVAIPGHNRCYANSTEKEENSYVAILITEGGNQGFRGMVAVAEVLRARRWKTRGFAGIRRKDLHDFLQRQPKRVHQQARQALQEARAGSNLTKGADHFENVERFGEPWWAKGMSRTVKIGDHTFYRSNYDTSHDD